MYLEKKKENKKYQTGRRKKEADVWTLGKADRKSEKNRNMGIARKKTDAGIVPEQKRKRNLHGYGYAWGPRFRLNENLITAKILPL